MSRYSPSSACLWPQSWALWKRIGNTLSLEAVSTRIVRPGRRLRSTPLLRPKAARIWGMGAVPRILTWAPGQGRETGRCEEERKELQRRQPGEGSTPSQPTKKHNAQPFAWTSLGLEAGVCRSGSKTYRDWLPRVEHGGCVGDIYISCWMGAKLFGEKQNKKLRVSHPPIFTGHCVDIKN